MAKIKTTGELPLTIGDDNPDALVGDDIVGNFTDISTFADSVIAALADKAPLTDILATSFAAAVQTSLGLADTALQPDDLPDASDTVKGLIRLSGDLAGTAASPTVPGLASKADKTELPVKDTRIFNVKDAAYGAKGDGRFLSTATMTSGSNVLTVGTSVFTTADVGKKIAVAGAASSSFKTNVLISTILSVESGTSITLANSASQTVSNARAVYGTDDTAATNAAYADATAIASTASGKNATVYLPTGIYIRTQQFTAQSRVNITGAGKFASTIVPVGTQIAGVWQNSSAAGPNGDG